MKTDILISDPVHIHRRNFSSLFEYLDKSSIRYKECFHAKHLRNTRVRECYHQEELTDYIEGLKALESKEIVKFEFQGIALRKIVEYELLGEMIAGYSSGYKYLNGEDFIRYAYQNHYSLLITSYALAIYWVDFWSNSISREKYRYAIIFSGASITTRALTKCCELMPTEPVLVESFFTGAHYYLENRYSPLPNKSDVRFFRDSTENIDSAKWKLSSEYLSCVSSRNKNVKQPADAISHLESNGYVLISCQVINDYSLLNSAYPKIASTEFYLSIIQDILDKTDLDVFVKVHPWERVKLAREISLTEEVIRDFANELPEDTRCRVKLIESENLSQLIEGCSAFITICSQSALEAVFLGKKPIVSSSAFYASKGFCYEFFDPAEVVSHILSEEYSSEICLSEYDNFINFMNFCMHDCLIEEKLTVASSQKLSRVLNGCVSHRPKTTTAKVEHQEYKYLIERNFIKRNIFKILERPEQILIDARVIFKALIKKIA